MGFWALAILWLAQPWQLAPVGLAQVSRTLHRSGHRLPGARRIFGRMVLFGS